MTRVGFEPGTSRLLCSDDVTTSAKALQSLLAILKSTFMETRAQVFLMGSIPLGYNCVCDHCHVASLQLEEHVIYGQVTDNKIQVHRL